MISKHDKISVQFKRRSSDDWSLMLWLSVFFGAFVIFLFSASYVQEQKLKDTMFYHEKLCEIDFNAEVKAIVNTEKIKTIVIICK